MAVVVAFLLLLLSPLSAQDPNEQDGSHSAMDLVRNGARAMDEKGNYTARIKKTMQTEITNQLYTRKKKTTGTLQRTNSHLLIKRSTSVEKSRAGQRKETTRTVRMIGGPDEGASLFVKREDRDWQPFGKSLRGNPKKMKEHIKRGIEARSVSVLKSATIKDEIRYRNTPCYLVSATGDDEKIRSMLDTLLRSLGRANVRIDMTFKKKNFTFWIAKSDPRILKFTSDLQISLTLTRPDRNTSQSLLQLIETEYVFSDVGTTSIPDRFTNVYRKRTEGR